MRRGIRKTQPQATNKQTNKRNQTKATLAQFINLSKAQMQKQGEQVQREGRGKGRQHTPGQVERFKKKMDQYFAAARAKTLTCQPGSSSVCVLARTIVCGIVTFLVPPPLSLFPLPHLCQHLGVLFFVSLSSRSVWKVNWIFHQRVDPSAQHQRPHSSGN